ncbi:hypothetical protein Btru_075471 [Bulinus truncatus]|nr:hypothetical protein Btru_075471 [Bulinus truncatus]
MLLPYHYTIQLFFQSPPLAVFTVLSMNYVLGEFYGFFKFYSKADGNDPCNNDYLILMKSPSDLLPNSACNILQNYRGRKFCASHYKYCNNPKSHMYVEACCKDNCTKSWDCSIFYRHDYLALTYPGVGVNLIAMMFHALFWAVLLMLIEYGCLRDLWSFISSKLRKKQPPKKRDDCCDVKAFSPFESYYIPFCSINSLTDAGQSDSGPDVVIKCEELSVSKRDSAGVVELSLDIGQSEVFCIVGSDSRTTSAVLDVMSGRKSATSGRVLIRGVPVNPLNLDKMQCVSYCPEKNTAIPFMTGRETLSFYAALCGINIQNRHDLVKLFLNAFRLEDAADKKISNYGNGRRGSSHSPTATGVVVALTPHSNGRRGSSHSPTATGVVVALTPHSNGRRGSSHSPQQRASWLLSLPHSNWRRGSSHSPQQRASWLLSLPHSNGRRGCSHSPQQRASWLLSLPTATGVVVALTPFFISCCRHAQRRRLNLAVAFISDPEILLLNDATNRLDMQGKKLLRDMVLTLRSLGKTVVLSSNR